MVLIVLKSGVKKDNETISKECIKWLEILLGQLQHLKLLLLLKDFQKQDLEKLLRGTIRKIADNEDYKIPATIDDPDILNEIKEDLIKNNIIK